MHFRIFEQLLQMGQEMGSERRPKSAANVEGIPLELQNTWGAESTGKGNLF